jgi:hypothetical protein
MNNKTILVFIENYKDNIVSEYLKNLKLKKKKFKLIVNDLDGYQYAKLKKYEYCFYNDFLTYSDRKKLIKKRSLYLDYLNEIFNKNMKIKNLFNIDQYAYLNHFDHVLLANTLSKKINSLKYEISIFLYDKINKSIFIYENLSNVFLSNLILNLEKKKHNS